MANLIIFEGCDASGKSTLIDKLYDKELRKILYIKPIHNGVYDSRQIAFDTYISQVINAKSSGQIITLFDRSYISELIYGSVLRDENNSEWRTHINYLEGLMLRLFKPLVIHCHIPYEDMFDNWVRRQDEEYIQEHENLKKVYYEYNNISNYTNLPVVTYNYLEPEKSLIRLLRKVTL